MQSLGIKYPNINAKLKGMYAKRITKEDLEDLVKQNNFKNSVLVLKTKDKIFENVDENIDRVEIEGLLDESLINDIKKIKKMLNRKDEENFDFFISQYEIKCIKGILRKLFSEDKNDDIVIKNVKRWSTQIFDDIKGIETVQNFEQFFNAIRRMKYKKILGKYENEENINIFEMENEIDKSYFETLYDMSNRKCKL